MENKKYIIPAHPARTYGDEWPGWEDFLNNPIDSWSKEEVLAFLLTLESELEFLDSIEILRIVEQTGSKNILNKNNNFLKLLDSSPYSVARNETISQLKKDMGGDIKNNDFKIHDELKNISKILDKPIELESVLRDVNESQRQVEDIKPADIAKYNFINELKAFDSRGISHYTDHETIEWLIKYRLDKLWNEIMSKKYDVENLIKETGGKYFSIIKNRFLEEYNKVIGIKIPEDYQFKDNSGNIASPNLMQKLVAHRLMIYKNYGNWSSMGSGKTLSAILAGRIIGLKNTLVITFNSNVEDWENALENSFPSNSKIYSKQKKYIPILDEEKYNYIIFNYETFQQENVQEIVDAIVSKNINFIVLDEVQMVKQRFEDNYSQRRRVVENLVRSIECKNNKKGVGTYKLTMSATPVINNLLEPKKTLELLTGSRYKDLKTASNVNNALNINKHMLINGIRFNPSYEIEVDTNFIKINGAHLLHKYISTPRQHALEIERLFIPDKLLAIKEYLRAGTMIYSHYVTGIIDPVKEFIENLGLSVGVYTGTDKSGLQCFKDKKCDILLCSSPVGTGVDGLQRVCDQLIVLTLPWTNSEYENLLGRIARQGSVFKKINVIIPQVNLGIKEISHSYDVNRMNIVDNKKTLSNIVLDAIIPSHLVPNQKEMVEDARSKFTNWIQRIQNEGLIQINRERLIICSSEGDVEIKQKLDEVVNKKTKKKIHKSNDDNECLIDNVFSKIPTNIIAKIIVPESDSENSESRLSKPKMVVLAMGFWVSIDGFNPTDQEIEFLKKNLYEELLSLYDEQIFELLKDNYYFPLRGENNYYVNFPDDEDNDDKTSFFVSVELGLHTINSYQGEITYPINFSKKTTLCNEIIKVYEKISQLEFFNKNKTFSISKFKPKKKKKKEKKEK